MWYATRKLELVSDILQIIVNDIINESNEDHNLKWPYIPDHPYRMLLIGVSGSGKTNALPNLIK